TEGNHRYTTSRGLTRIFGDRLVGACAVGRLFGARFGLATPGFCGASHDCQREKRNACCCWYPVTQGVS
ncbi:MAG: hypothetical protein L0J68_06345, partial [Micrococcaceae bacterium]|nr:hypothetical protein [Micrococcaceae bacterium]